MKRFLLLTCFVVLLSLSSCQCSEKPDVGPVEDDEAVVAAPQTEWVPLTALPA